MKVLYCPYCKKPIYEVTKKFGEASHMRGCYHNFFGKKAEKNRITIDYYESNFENCNKDFFIEKINDGWSVYEIDNTFFEGLDITRRMCTIYGIKLRNLKEALSLNRQKEKRENTNIKKYGFKNVLSNGSIKRIKRDITMKEKYGVSNFFSIKNFQAFLKEKMGEEEYHKRKSERSKEVWKNKTIEEKTEWLQKSIHCHFIDDNGLYTSKQELLLREKLIKLGFEIETQKRIENFYYDILLKGTNIIIEYNGAYWHADPKKYKPDDILFDKKTAKEIWKKDSLKKEIAIKNGYNIITIWEDEFLEKELEEILEEKISFLER